MDLYATSFTLPPSHTSTPFLLENGIFTSIEADGAAVPAAGGPAITPATAAPVPTPPPQPSTGRMGSMRSRFPPSVKAFMPSAFGGLKRTNERIAEVVKSEAEEAEGEIEGDVKATTASGGAEKSVGDSEATALALESTAADVSAAAVGDHVQTTEDLADPRHAANRDSRSTVGTRSSLDFSTTSGDGAVVSTAPSTSGGVATDSKSHARTQSEQRSVGHSASTSFSGSGHVSRKSGDLGDAIRRMVVDVMASSQCLVSFTPVQAEEAQASAALNQAFPRQVSYSPHTGASHARQSQNVSADAPYQQAHNLGRGFGFNPMAASHDALGMSGGFSGGAGAASTVSLPTTLNLLQQQQQYATGVYPTPYEQPILPLNSQSVPPPPPPKPQAPQFNFYLSGGYQQVIAARGAILRDNPFKISVSVKAPPADILVDGGSAYGSPDPASASSPRHSFSNSTDALKSDVKRRLDDIASATRTSITLVGSESHGADLGYGMESEHSVELVATGSVECAEQARIRMLVLLDELSGLHTETCEIDYKMHNIIGGRKRCVLQTIQEETATNIYFASPFAGVLCSPQSRPQGISQRQNTIYITGEFFGVQRARDMLFQILMHKSKMMISRDTAIPPRKLDWLMLERSEELRTIMIDNATFVKLPLLGTQASLITVIGDHRVTIERTIRSLMALTTQFYIASLWLLPVTYDLFVPTAALSPAQMTPVLKNISNLSGAEVVFKTNCFEVHGLESEVRTAIGLILDLELVKSYNFEVRFQIELANEHREFISGKKNGKINKIMKQCGVRMKFETFNDYNFLIEISGNDRSGAMQGLELLQEELPAEVSFHVPETYHKRIIGVGGKNIQRIMKKYGVYVKFSNAEEFAALGGYLDNEDNVIARTPAKNSINLENLKQSVMELVNSKDKDYVTETVTVARRYQRTLLGEKGIFIHDIEAKTSSIVRFPPKELGSDLVTIFGPESQIHVAAQMVLEHVPFEAHFRVPTSQALAQTVGTHEFVALTQRIKRDFNIVVLPPVRQGQSTEVVFRLRLNRSNSDFLPTTKDLIEEFLISRNVTVYTSSRARSDSFASSFKHFATKLISGVPAESTDSLQLDAARYNERRLRAPASTPDIKALFEAPSYTTRNYTTTAVNSPLVPTSIYSSPYGEGRTQGPGSDMWPGENHSRVPSSSDNVWAAPRLMASSSQSSLNLVSFPLSSQSSLSQMPSVPIGSNTTQHYPHMSDDMHKHSDSAALGLDERMRALRKPRSFAHRTQSLDIDSMAQQNQATAQPRGMAGRSFNHSFHHSQQSSGRPGVIGSSGHQPAHVSSQSIPRIDPVSSGTPTPDPATMDEVSRVLAQLAFE